MKRKQSRQCYELTAKTTLVNIELYFVEKVRKSHYCFFVPCVKLLL